MSKTSQDTLKALSDCIDAFAAAKMANNESLIRFSINQLQEFINAHDITPAEGAAEPATGSVDLAAG
jgi:hypothetical protein